MRKIQKSLFDGIRKIVKSEIGEALKNLNFSRTKIEKSENCKISETSKNEKLGNAPAAVFEKTVISPYDENEENDKLVDTVFLDR